MRASSWLAIGGLAAMVACGHGGDHGVSLSGTDLSCGSNTYIVNGECQDLPPFSDASVSFDDGEASSDVGPSDGKDDSQIWDDESPSDEAEDAPSSMTSLDLLAPCAAASDIFFVQTAYLPQPPTTNLTYTNLDATFQADVQPTLQIAVTPNDGGPRTVLLLPLTNEGGAWTAAIPTPGTYETAASGIDVQLYLDGVYVPYDSGTIAIEDAQIHESDGAPDRLHSLLLSYDLVNRAGQTIRGCVRYIEGDAGP